MPVRWASQPNTQNSGGSSNNLQTDCQTTSPEKNQGFLLSAPPDETIEKSPITIKTVSPITGFYMDPTFNLNADAKSGNKCEV
jgi:hypothetical protein